MKNRFIFTLAMAVCFLMFLSSSSFAAMGSVDSFKYEGLKEDLLGKESGYSPDGSRDGMFQVSISGVGAVAGFSIKAQDRGSVWHSAPDSGELPLLIVDSRGESLNKGGGFPIIPILLSTQFKLYVADDGHLARKTETYVLEVKYIDGSTSSSSVVVQAVSEDVPGTGNSGAMYAVLAGFTDADLAGPDENLAPDGAKDARIRMEKLKRGVISSITIRNRTGRFSIWDTEPSNGRWSIVVVEDGEIRNSTDGSILMQVSENSRIDLLFADNGSVKAKDTTYEVAVTYRDGRKFSIPVSYTGVVPDDKAGDEAFSAILYGRSGKVAKPGVPDIMTFENDHTSASEKMIGNGKPDWGIRLRVNKETSIISVKMENMDGEYGIWDTLPGNGKWLIAVTDEHGKILNEDNGSLDLSITTPATLWLWVTDTGALERGKTRYRISLMSHKGDVYSTILKKPHSWVPVEKPKVQPKVIFKARYLGIGDKDFVGKYDGLRRDGSKDTRIRLFVDKLDSRIEEIILRDRKGKNIVWDTIRNNKRWSIMVTTTGGVPLNSTDGSVSIPVKGKKTLNVWVQDNGTLKEGRIPFEVLLRLDDGRTLRTSLLR